MVGLEGGFHLRRPRGCPTSLKIKITIFEENLTHISPPPPPTKFYPAIIVTVTPTYLQQPLSGPFSATSCLLFHVISQTEPIYTKQIKWKLSRANSCCHNNSRVINVLANSPLSSIISQKQYSLLNFSFNMTYV